MSRQPRPALVAEMLAMVAPAEAAFHCRWRLSTLARVDAELHGLLLEQEALYGAALASGSDADAKLQSEAMVRGWRAAVAAMEDPLRPDDAYLVGRDQESGTVVVIAEQKGSVARQSVSEGQTLITVTPDEVAKLLAGLDMIREAKSLFGDAEIVGFIPIAEQS